MPNPPLQQVMPVRPVSSAVQPVLQQAMPPAPIAKMTVPSSTTNGLPIRFAMRPVQLDSSYRRPTFVRDAMPIA